MEFLIIFLLVLVQAVGLAIVLVILLFFALLIYEVGEGLNGAERWRPYREPHQPIFEFIVFGILFAMAFGLWIDFGSDVLSELLQWASGFF